MWQISLWGNYIAQGMWTILKNAEKKYGFALYEFIAFESRFFFVMIDEDIAIACHAFRKKGQKTPPQEINKAIRTAMEVRNKYQLK